MLLAANILVEQIELPGFWLGASYLMVAQKELRRLLDEYLTRLPQ
jgi:hypothetical protein